MEYKYFTLDKNPKQFKRISIGEYSIELRIEWNTRSKAWYVLGYSGDEIVISNVKMTPNQLYSIDIDSEYDLPYMIGIIPKYTNYDWDTETTFLIVDNPLSNAVEGLTADGGVIERSITTSSDTHSRKALKGTENKYLFDVVSITQETGITIVCNGADASFKTVNLPQGRWDFTINGLRTITADTESFRSLMNDYGVQIVDVGNNEYLWTNNSNQEIKIEGLYPYAAGYDFNVVESTNDSAKIHSVDNNGWVNRFTVCLVPASSLIWTIASGGVSSDYQYVNFTGEQSVFESTARLGTTQALVEKYRGGVDPYSATIVNELTGVSDWVLDPNNNRIKYFTEPTDPNNPTLQYLWTDGRNNFTTAKEALESSCRGYRGSSYVGISNLNVTTDRATAICLSSDGLSNVGSSVQRVNNPNYDPNAEREEKYLPLETVAQQVISNAESGNIDAQKVALSAALEKPLVSSLSDSNMQQWQAVKDAIGGLTGATEWTFDNADEVVRYAVINPDLNAVASTLTQRHSRSPSDFVGVNSFRSIIESNGWNIDEGGQVKKPNTDISWDDPSVPQYYETSGWTYSRSPSGSGTCALVSAEFKQSVPTHPGFTYEQITSTDGRCKHNTSTNNAHHLSVRIISNPLYDPTSPESVVVSDSELQTALKNALESSNPDLAAAIADAVAAAYTYDVVGFNELYNSLSVTYQQVAERIAQNSKSVDQSIVLPTNAYITEALLKFTNVDSIKSQFEANKQPK